MFFCKLGKQNKMKSRLPLLSFFLLVFTIGSARAALPDFTALVEQVNPMVLQITTEIKMGQRTRTGPSGSGFIISTDGYILTNHHVVAEAVSIKVKLHDGRVLEAEKIGQDEPSDVALLKVTAKNLPAAKIGDVKKLKAGAWVLAFGAPFGFDHSVSAGIVSAKGRSLPWNAYVPFIQSDASINRGNSGGPLVNADGEVVGINSQILSSNGGSIGLSFSIPIDLAIEVSEQLKKTGKVERGYIGVGYQEVSAEIASSFGLDRPRGAVITQVSKGDAADKAGLKAGDVILSVDGITVENAGALPVIVGRIKPGAKAKFEILREGKPKTVTVTIGARPDAEVASGPGNSQQRLGVIVTELDPERAEEQQLDGGVLVQSVVEGPFADAGVRPGDVILSINLQDVRTVAEFNAVVAELPAGKSVPIHVVRRGNAQFLVLRIPEQ